MGARLTGMVMLVCLGLAACGSGKDPKLLYFTDDQPGPDEFAILPTLPLEPPADFTTLPPPTPGGTNRTDQTPQADAVAALGGNRERVLAGGGVQDTALIARATRYGVQDGIRDQLAAEDLDHRRKNDGLLLERLFKSNVYFKAYRKFQLDQYRELERFRAAGIRTPAVPPEGK